MPLSPKEKTELESNGRFTREQIRFFETAQVSYDKIKELQDIEQKLAALEGLDLPLRDINFRMIYNLRPLVRSGIISEEALDTYINNALEDIEQYRDGNIEYNHADNETDSSIGGRRHRKGRTKRRKSRRSRSRGKKSRRIRIRIRRSR